MEQANITEKIQAIKALFKNIRDTLSRDEINDIRYKILEILNSMSTMLIKQTSIINKQTHLTKLLII